MLVWLDGVQKEHPQSKVIYRETLPSHFNSNDGTYESWQVVEHQDLSAYNTWDPALPRYYCRALPDNVVNRIENIFVREKIAASKFNISILSTFRHFAPFYKMHHGSCDHDSDDHQFASGADCVHICGFAPAMWMPIWAELKAIIVDKIEPVPSY